MGFENGKLLRVTLEAKGGPLAHVTTLHYDLQDVGVSADANDPQSLADTFRDDVLDHYALMFTSFYTIQPVTVIMEKDPLNPTQTRDGWISGADRPGIRTVGTEGLPVQMCAVASLKTGHIGRRARGRSFLGGSLVEGDQDNGVWQSGILGIWQAFLDSIPRQPDIAAPLSLSRANWCVYSRTQRAANLDPYAPAIEAVSLGTAVHWLRSRGT